MPKTPCADYRDELRLQRAAWARKASLRRLYHAWYADVVAALAPLAPVVEVGAGCGNFKAFRPDTVATDAFRVGDWLDAQADARALPFRPASVGNFVLVDVLHHLPRPLACLRAAAAALRPGGRIVLLEPAATPWARCVFGACHHEPLDLAQDFLAEDGTPAPPNPDGTYSNMATATALFVRRPAAALARLPGLALAAVRHSDFLAYPLTGGFGYRNLLPAALVRPLRGLEGLCLRGLLARLLAMRLWVVLERRA